MRGRMMVGSAEATPQLAAIRFLTTIVRATSDRISPHEKNKKIRGAKSIYRLRCLALRSKDSAQSPAPNEIARLAYTLP
jgi:hypothetical protein